MTRWIVLHSTQGVLLQRNIGYKSIGHGFYLESGSYVRMRALQIGFTPPAGFVRWIPAQRIYLQAENLFTITGYPGLDPSLPSANIYGASGDLRDQYMGVDRGNYPSNRTFTIGITTTF